MEERKAPPAILSIGLEAIAAYAGDPCEVIALQMPELAPTSPYFETSTMLQTDPGGLPLSEADFVVSAGNGVTDFGAFRDLAKALKATPGASRMVCDAGLMPRAAQVGASGTVLEASIYFALGIAGAPQHLQGIGKVEHVVAINTDLHAAMVARAELAIIADAQEVMPALIALLAEKTP